MGCVASCIGGTGLAHLGLGFKNKPGRSWMPGSKPRRTQQLPTVFMSLTRAWHHYLLKKLSKAKEQDTGESLEKAWRKYGESSKKVMCPGAFTRFQLHSALQENRLRDSLDALDAAFQALRWQPKLLSRHIETIEDTSWYIVPNWKDPSPDLHTYRVSWSSRLAEVICRDCLSNDVSNAWAQDNCWLDWLWAPFLRGWAPLKPVRCAADWCANSTTKLRCRRKIGGWGQKPWRSRAIFAGITTIATCT